MDTSMFRLEEIALKYPPSLEKVEAFLAANDLAFDRSIEKYYGVFRGDALVGGAGYDKNVIKCAAVSPEYRGEGILNALASRIITDLSTGGHQNIFVFTKPGNRALFESLAFHSVESTRDVLLMESDKNGFRRYLDNLRPLKRAIGNGAAVMNCNPFTLGHQYLIKQAAAGCGQLVVFVVEEDVSAFPYAARLRLVREGTAEIPNVTVVPGGPYIVSAATFPSYFLGDTSRAAKAHTELDITIFGKHIAPAAGVVLRFAGEEPLSPVTNLYNQAMTAFLPKFGVGISIIPRLQREGDPISASRVRKLLAEGKIEETRTLVPESTYNYLISPEAAAVRKKLAAGHGSAKP